MAESNVANYADDTTLYAREKKLFDLQRKLESESLILFKWFRNNYLKTNTSKSHLMLATDNKLKINVKGSLISNEEKVKLLGVTVDNKLSFEPLLNLVCKMVSIPCPFLGFKVYFKEKTKSYHKENYDVAITVSVTVFWYGCVIAEH